jgi:hypothetical protein
MAANSLKTLSQYYFDKDYPYLKGNYTKTSDETILYNCVAYVLGEYDKIYSSYEEEGIWIDGLEKTHTPKNYADFFKKIKGFEICKNADFDDKYEKIAIYGLEDEFLHVAIQLQNGKWSSKIGEYEDIEHNSLKAVGGGRYGYPIIFMQRLRK